MLNSLDQWAAGFLLAVNVFMGISSIPIEKSDNWRAGWVNIDGREVLNMESKTVGPTCKENAGGFYIFPQVYMGQITIFVDGKAVYTNSMSEKWNLFSMLSRPVVNCELLYGNEVIYRVYSYNSYFATTQTYPYYSRKMPISQIFYEEMFIISALIAFVVGCISILIMGAANLFKEGLNLFIFQLSLGFVAVSQSAGRFFDLYLGITHTLVVSTSVASLLTFMISTFSPRKIYIYFGAWMSCALAFTFIYLNPYGNLVSFLILVLLIPGASIISFCMFIYKYITFREDKDVILLILYGLFFLVITIDSILSQYIRESFFHISFLVIVGSIITFYRIINIYYIQLNNNFMLKHRLEIEHQKFKTISESLLYLKEVIHDIKSPIMSVSFFLTDPALYKNQLEHIVGRISDIINRISLDNLKKHIGWYSIDFLKSKIHEITDSKIATTKDKIQLDLQIDIDIELYIDPLDLLIVIDELIVNALKYSNDIVKIKISLTDVFSIQVENTYTEQAIKDPWSYGSGIANAKRKISSMDGKLYVTNSLNYFMVTVVLQHRLFNL